MKKLFIIAALVLALSAAVPARTAYAASSISLFKGLTAVALFSSTDPAGCITDAFVLATKSKSYDASGKASASSATVTIARSGNCADMLGTFDGSITPLPSGAFKVDPYLAWATLNTGMNVCSPEACFDVTVALTWRGAGALTFQQSHDHTTLGSCTIDTVSIGLERPAVAAGRVVNGATNFTPARSTDAVIDLAASGQFQKGCA